MQYTTQITRTSVVLTDIKKGEKKKEGHILRPNSSRNLICTKSSELLIYEINRETRNPAKFYAVFL